MDKMPPCSITMYSKSVTQHPEMGGKLNEWLEWSQRRLSDSHPTCQVVQGLADPRMSLCPAQQWDLSVSEGPRWAE